LILNYFTKENPGLIWDVQTKIYGPDLNKMKGYFCSHPDRSTKIQRSEWLLLHSAGETEEATGRRHGQRQESLGLHYGALNFDLIPPTRSRWHKELILLTCGDVNGSHSVSSVSGVRAGSNGIEVLVLPSSFLSGQLLQTAAENQIWWLPSVRRVLDLRAKIHTMGCAIS
jgi:hypothetical protein